MAQRLWWEPGDIEYFVIVYRSQSRIYGEFGTEMKRKLHGRQSLSI